MKIVKIRRQLGATSPDPRLGTFLCQILGAPLLAPPPLKIFLRMLLPLSYSCISSTVQLRRNVKAQAFCLTIYRSNHQDHNFQVFFRLHLDMLVLLFPLHKNSTRGGDVGPLIRVGPMTIVDFSQTSWWIFFVC